MRLSGAALRRGIGFLGGTFDPVHNGHLAIAEAAMEAMPLMRVELLLAPNPWQKTVLTSVSSRASMIREALETHPGLRLNLSEVCRPGYTYTIDTLASLRSERGPSVPLVLLMGFDQWKNLNTWKDWTKLTDFASIAVFNRGEESPVPDCVREWSKGRILPPERIADAPSGAVSFFRMAPHEASSTEIRRLLGMPYRADRARILERWLPHGTAHYIYQHGLYGVKRPQ